MFGGKNWDVDTNGRKTGSGYNIGIGLTDTFEVTRSWKIIPLPNKRGLEDRLFPDQAQGLDGFD